MGGGNISSKRYEVMRARSVKRASIIIASVFVTYLVLAESGLVERSPLYEQTPAIIATLMLSVLLVSIWHPITQSGKVMKYLYFLLLHATAIYYVAAISGFLSPATLVWLYFAIMSSVHYSRLGSMLSIAFLYTAMTISLHSITELNYAQFSAHMLYATAIALVGWLMRDIHKVQLTEHDELISTQRREKTQKAQLLALINSVPQAIISVDTKGNILLYNAASLDLLDTNRSLMGEHIDDVLHAINQDKEPIKFIDELDKLEHNTQRDDLSHRYEDGDIARLSMSCSILYSQGNNVDGFIIVIRDITKEKTLDEERDEFISVVSHELRTPITIAEGTVSNVQLLLKRGATPDVVSQSIKSAHDQIIYLARMVNDLSTLSRAERGADDAKELIDLKELAEQLYTEYMPHAEENNLTLNLEVPSQRMQVYASRLYLEEILQNFVTNAIKYTKEGSVTLRICALGINSANIEVEDTGIGISKSDQKKIFEKFYRSEDYRTRETSGTGLGLYVVQKLARKLGVLISLDSVAGKGSTFSFSIPLADKSQIAQAKSELIDSPAETK